MGIVGLRLVSLSGIASIAFLTGCAGGGDSSGDGGHPASGPSCTLAADQYGRNCNGYATPPACGDVMKCFKIAESAPTRCRVSCANDGDCQLVGAGQCVMVAINAYANANYCSGQPTTCPAEPTGSGAGGSGAVNSAGGALNSAGGAVSSAGGAVSSAGGAVSSAGGERGGGVVSSAGGAVSSNP